MLNAKMSSLKDKISKVAEEPIQDLLAEVTEEEVEIKKSKKARSSLK